MRILIATDSYRHQLNGVTNSILLLSDELRRRGHTVKVLSLSESRHSYRDEDEYYISSLSSLVYPDFRISLTFHDRFLKELADWKPDIVHIQTEFSAKRLAMKVIQKNQTPFVMSHHTHYEDYLKPYVGKRLLNRLASVFYQKAYGHTRLLIVPSEKAKEVLGPYGLTCPITIIPNGIDMGQERISEEEKSRLLSELQIEHNGKVMVNVSRISREKNIDELIDFFSDYLKTDPQASLLIVGGGPQLKQLKKKAEEAGLEKKIIFSGMIPHAEVYKYYQLGDLFVCASTFETQGLTYFEAMANGLPLLCRRDKCLKDVISEGQNGFTYTTEEEFLAHAAEILNDPTRRQMMGKASEERSEQYTKDEFVSSLEHLYRQIIDSAEPEPIQKEG